MSSAIKKLFTLWNDLVNWELLKLHRLLTLQLSRTQFLWWITLSSLEADTLTLPWTISVWGELEPSWTPSAFISGSPCNIWLKLFVNSKWTTWIYMHNCNCRSLQIINHNPICLSWGRKKLFEKLKGMLFKHCLNNEAKL